MHFFIRVIGVSLALCGCGGGGVGTSPTPPSATAPLISSLAPSSAVAGGAAFTATVNGSRFVAASTVAWNGTPLPTHFASATQLTAQVPASNIATVATAHVTVVNAAADGGASAAVAFEVAAPHSGAPALVQTNTFQTNDADSANDSSLQFESATTAGDTIWVAVTVPDFGGIHTIAVTDSQGNAYTMLDQKNDGQPGTQSVAHFYAANILGDAATPDVIHVSWGNDNYKGILIAEISGVTKTPLVGHNAAIQDGLPAGTDNVTSGPIQVAADQTPALLVALSMNTSGGASDTGGSGAPGPAAGSGLTQVAVLWKWGANLATFATGTVTGAESVTSLFSAPDTDSYVTVTAVFH